MRFIRIAGLCLVALAAMAMATAATASAAGPVWEVNGTEVKGTEKVMGTGTLRLTDTATLVGESTVECSGTTQGVIGPGKYNRVQSITVSSCKAIKGCENVETVKPLHLPWQTELTEKSGQVRDTITSGTAKLEPGWEVECKAVIAKQKDVCETEESGKEGSTLETNETVHGYVLATFGPTSKAKCSQGGSSTGEVGGIITTLSEPTGKAIRVS